MTKLIRAIIKYSLWPASLMILGKIAGLVIAVTFYKLTIFSTNEVDGLFSYQLLFISESETQLANSISNITMLSLLLLGYFYFTIKYFLSSSIANNPKTIVKLVRMNLIGLITGNNYSFLKSFLWSAYMISACLISLIASLNGNSYSWIGLVSFIIILGCVWGLIKSFEIESSKIYPENNKILY